ncbi:basement membrane-specific heparan sulfate proteoglycan core protein-like isoform X2 [Mizuhopecten yessoensis]|uniref:basement membrane-specific heparan sulfate proteoglycan core protein-like isoform X2 n=1 Tax=Mizuhopecten yessoensis TaxID=6573 RepID=UPI000B45A012|nr:basement membrane-specific heparan sulfate proteoglycan core protein-like isoform X2 [Mizuhopecten yessoensis]
MMYIIQSLIPIHKTAADPPGAPVVSVDTSKGGRLPWLANPSFTGSLQCRVTPGNPDFQEISWYNNGEIDPYRSLEYRMFDPPDKIYNGRNFTCRVSNKFTREKGTVVESNGIVLDIQYTPVITLDQSNAYVNETMSFRRTCSAEGNPTPTVTWTGASYRGPIGPVAVLELNATDRSDTGSHFCYASSNASKSYLPLSATKSFTLFVQHGPDEVTLNMPENTTENVTNIQLICQAYGLPASTFRWTHSLGGELIRDTFDHVTETQLSSTLTLHKLTYQDMGTYRCEAENGYKGRDGLFVYSQSGLLNVQARPRVINAKKLYVVEKDESLDINITFHSFPKPHKISITKLDSILPSSDDLAISNMSVPVSLPFHTKRITVDGSLVRLHFKSVQPRLEGQYQLFVNNTLPYFYTVQVTISDRPDPPQHLAIDTRSRNHDKAAVSWSPGSNGGHEQIFTVMYTK